MTETPKPDPIPATYRRATRADLLHTLGDTTVVHAANERALALATNPRRTVTAPPTPAMEITMRIHVIKDGEHLA